MTKTIAELIEQRFGLPSETGHDTPAEGDLAAILSHRTHPRYTDTPISEDLMQQAPPVYRRQLNRICSKWRSFA